MTWDDARARAALRRLFDTAVAAADPRHVLAAHLPPKPTTGRCVVVGGGKSAAVMAAALEDAWPDVALEGTVVTRYGHGVPTRRIEVIEASHPVPDANSERGARRLLERVTGTERERSGHRTDVGGCFRAPRGSGGRPFFWMISKASTGRFWRAARISLK